MTLVYLLRHGATAANREVPYRLQGRGSDRPLDEVGRAQAEAASEALAGVDLDAVYSSPLARARQTAEAVARRHRARVVPVADLVEGDVGRWEGLTWDEAAALDPEICRRFLESPGSVPYPDGESFADVQRRAAPAFGSLARLHEGGRVAVVGHNILNRAYLAGVLGVPIDRARAIRQSNGGINLLEFEPGGGVVLVTLNSVLHLAGTLAPR